VHVPVQVQTSECPGAAFSVIRFSASRLGRIIGNHSSNGGSNQVVK